MNIQELSYKNQSIRIVDGDRIVVTDVAKVLGLAHPAKDVASILIHNIDQFRPHMSLTTIGGTWLQLLTIEGTILFAEMVPSVESIELVQWLNQLGKPEESNSLVLSLQDEITRLQKLLEPDWRLTPEQKGSIRNAVSKLVHRCQSDGLDVSYQTVYSALNARFGIASYTDIPRVQFQSAMAFLAKYWLRGEKRVS